MSFLRTRLRTLREPFGKAGLTVGVIALVMAMVGGAYAAGGLTKSQEKQVTKIAKKYAGKPGATGTNGTAGTNGTNGKDGAAGKDGTNGAPGESVKLSAAGACPEGGTKLTVGAESKEVCNGEEGEPGQTGFTEKLPSGSTETGVWSFSAATDGAPLAQVSFSIPLAAALDNTKVHYVEGTGNGTTCAGSATTPTAEAGNLCVYQVVAQGVELTGALANANVLKASKSFALTPEVGAATSGAVVLLSNKETGSPYGYGTWAVTAP